MGAAATIAAVTTVGATGAAARFSLCHKNLALDPRTRGLG
jgi:hypothetical protein